MSKLSPAALAVWEAFNQDEAGVFVDYGDKLSAALRAAAQHVEDLYCADPVIDDSDGAVFVLRQLLLIAAELDAAELFAIAAELEAQ